MATKATSTTTGAAEDLQSTAGQLHASGGGSKSVLNISSAVVARSGPGRVVRVSVIVAGSTAGAVYDGNATSGNSAANQIAVIPTTAAAGAVVQLEWPVANGVVVVPGTGATLAVACS